MKQYQDLKKILGEKLRENVLLRELTTMKVGGVADYFYEADSPDELVAAVKVARDENISYFILGNGSNIVVSDSGFPGLVIHNRTSNLAFLPEHSQVIADSGVSLARLIMESASKDLAGLEFLAGIPGTVGGAVYGNAGAKGFEIGDYIKTVTLFNPKNKIVRVKAPDLDFSYRSSKLKKDSPPKPIILSIKFQLSHNRKEEIVRKIGFYKELRHKTQPWGQTAGSIFKNPDTSAEMAAGYLLEQANAKKLKVGKAFVSKKHANFVMTSGKAKAADVRLLIERMREKVRDKHQVVLEEEIEYIGRW